MGDQERKGNQREKRQRRDSIGLEPKPQRETATGPTATSSFSDRVTADWLMSQEHANHSRETR